MKEMEELIDATVETTHDIHQFYQQLLIKEEDVPMSILYIATFINLKKLEKQLRLDFRADDEVMHKMDIIAQDLFEGLNEAFDRKMKNLT